MIPCDRKDLFKERKHERSESIGSVAKWRDSSSHHGDFRPGAGHGKQGGWHLFPEESGHGYALSRSGDKMLEEDNGRSSVSQGDGKYGRINREIKGGSFSLRDWRGRSLETANGSLNLSRRQLDKNNDQRSLADMLTHSSHPHSDFVNTLEQAHCKDQHDKMGGGNGYRESSLSSTDWKPLKWTRSGSLSLRGSNFGHSSSPKRMGGSASCEGKVGLQHKNATAVESNSGEASACWTSALSEEANSRKKSRLNWGEGLAKFEKKKVEWPDVSANKDGSVSSPIHMELGNFLNPSLVDKSPKVSGFSDCASPSTPSSLAYNSSPGVDDKLFGKAANVDNGVSNSSGSPGPGSHDHLQMFPFNLEKVDIDSLSSSGSSLVELLQSEDLNSLDSSPLRSTRMNKLLILKADISKVLEVTETEIDLLENELKSLKSESGDRFPCSAAAGSLLVCYNAKSCDEHVGASDKIARPEPLQIVSSDDPNVKMPRSTNLHAIHDNGKEDHIDSPGTAISKFVEPLPMISSSDVGKYDTCSDYLDGIQSTSVKNLVPCTYRQVASVSASDDGNSLMDVKEDMDAKSGVRFYSSTEDNLYNTIISCNKESAKEACEVFSKLLPEECGKISNIGDSSDSCSRDGAFIMKKFAEKKRFARFKERVITLKFKALHHQWKKDMRLLSIRKCRLKSMKKLELGLRTISNGHQKNRSSVHFRFPFPAGKQRCLIPTSEMISYTSQLLSESSDKIYSSSLKMPALILDQKEKIISKFLSKNGLVEDPLAIEKERAMINLWTLEEREIFLEKFAAFGKDFRKIASFLDHKTTADCVEYYYKNHKSECFEKIKKKDGGKLGKLFTVKTGMMASGKKWNSEVNAASLEILSAASVMADGIAGNRKMHPGCSIWRGYADMETSRGEDSITHRSRNLDILQDERETVAADVLAGICGSLSSEAMSSRITSSVDPLEGNRDRKRMKVRSLCKQPMVPVVTQCIDDETCSDESCDEMDATEWTDGEKAAFLQAVSSFGNNFAMIAQCIGTRSQNQCKAFFSKARKCLRLDLMQPRPENIGSLMNDDGNGGRSDTDDVCVVETSSVIGTDTSGTKTDEDLPSSVMNAYHESNPMKARDQSADLNESKDISGEEVNHEDVNMISNASVNKAELKLGTDGNGVVLCSSEKYGSIGDQSTIIMSDSIEFGKDKPNVLGDVVTELVSASEIIEPCHSNSVAEDRLVSEVSSGFCGNELEGSPTCLVDSDDIHEADKDVDVEMKNKVYDSTTTVNTSPSSVGISCSILNFDAENQPQLCLDEKSHLSGSLAPTAANSKLKNMASITLQCEKTASQDLLSSNCDFQGSRDISDHNSNSNGGYQLHNPGNQLNEASRTFQCYPLQVPVKEVNVTMSCSNLATELPLSSQKFVQADDCYKTQLRCLSDSEKPSRNGDVKLFGKILTNPSSMQKPNLTANGNDENDTHHLKLSSTSRSLKFTGDHNADGRSTILKFDHNDYRGVENVPITSYWDGSKIQSGFSSLPDSAVLLAKYPGAFSDYPMSAKLEQQSLQASAKNDEQHLSGASAFTTSREVNGSNGMIDHQMFKIRDDLKVQQPFMVDVKQRQDAVSEMRRGNGFEAISGSQQQVKGMVGINGVGMPGVAVGGGSQSGVSDAVAAIKMHYTNADQCGMREDKGGI